ncbi:MULTISPECIES: hypothetical protein [Acetobacter]|uniref:Uncharacterized protein n=1 Tax=Acetobacter pomorum DM001 TaxID=945681 RepID=F1YR63_9PROT|nr:MULTISPECIES: hypothetical protein [Acetobacter]ATI11038.1 hypothetical protein CPF11_00345 [Acetobacter pomorum]AXC26622.1 hypothetical protein DS739_07320 [Acetobacter sp. JWB]EGE48723.1 Hypothetical protein APO_0388 [Acetobacter pomorum DM001]KAA8386019.1 hypothetical protein FKW31_07580 [Acetobacter sp. DmW_136]KAA8420343.1 hypothetical protein FKW54_13990 [Acetobacter pomorum]
MTNKSNGAYIKATRFFLIITFCLIILLFVIGFFMKSDDIYYDYDFSSQEYKHPVLHVDNVPKNMIPIAQKAFDALLDACPGLKAASSRGESWDVLAFPERLGGLSPLKDVSFLFETDINKEVFSKFPKGLQDPQWGNHIMYRIDLVKHGVWMDWPTDIWLCHESLFGNQSSDQDFIMGYQRTWHQSNVFKSIPDMPSLPDGPLSHPKVTPYHRPNIKGGSSQKYVSEAMSYLGNCTSWTGDLSCMSAQDKFVRQYVNALAGDYAAQKDVIFDFMLPEDEDGPVKASKIQGCAWAQVVAYSGSPYVTKTDRSMMILDCDGLQAPDLDASKIRAAAINHEIKTAHVHRLPVPEIEYDPRSGKNETEAD